MYQRTSSNRSFVYIKIGICKCNSIIFDKDPNQYGDPNCHDLCKNNTNKVKAEQCDWNYFETKANKNNTINSNDWCGLDVNETEPEICGCNDVFPIVLNVQNRTITVLY